MKRVHVDCKYLLIGANGTVSELFRKYLNNFLEITIQGTVEKYKGGHCTRTAGSYTVIVRNL